MQKKFIDWKAKMVSDEKNVTVETLASATGSTGSGTNHNPNPTGPPDSSGDGDSSQGEAPLKVGEHYMVRRADSTWRK